MADNLINEAKTQLRQLRKGNIDVFPDQLYLQCGSIEIRSDGKSRNTTVRIDGQLVTGIFSIRVNLNTQRNPKIEIGAFLDDLNLIAKPQKENKNA